MTVRAAALAALALAAWLGCARHVVIERDAVSSRDDKQWTIGHEPAPPPRVEERSE